MERRSFNILGERVRGEGVRTSVPESTESGVLSFGSSTDDLNRALPRLGMAARLVEGFGGGLSGCVESTGSAPGKSSAQGSRGPQKQEPRRRLEMPTAARFARGESNPPC